MSRIIETPRLELRPWTTEDLEGARSIYAAPAVTRWLPSATVVGPPDDLKTLLATWVAADSASPGCLGHWAVTLRSSPEVVGGLSLQPAPHASESVAVAWALAPDAWGNGYATEAANALVRWAMHEGGVMEVFAIVDPGNARALETAVRIGMEWVTDLNQPTGRHYRVYRIRHGDLDWEG
ncbi:GNAT family N-acetyltransferase [Nocardioides sp. NBC_00368]|uniref:GNAT family N-acetyltransferase n=1 Tax=Nocardioides sp. NBC_00368 TaxID=2976000 RepID=UPI002E1DE1E2